MMTLAETQVFSKFLAGKSPHFFGKTVASAFLYVVRELVLGMSAFIGERDSFDRFADFLDRAAFVQLSKIEV